MPTTKRKQLFVSYARADERGVLAFLDLLRTELDRSAIGIDLWQDTQHLQPGTSWQRTILDALSEAVGMLVFVSPSSMKSDWVRRELDAAIAAGDRLVVPVILQHVPDLPDALRTRQWLDISSDLGDTMELRNHAISLVRSIKHWLDTHVEKAPLPAGDAEQFAALAAEATRRSVAPPRGEAEAPTPDSVFVVHGHDTATRDLVCEALRSFGVRPVVLSQMFGASQSLLQKFLGISQHARFAVVLLSADDFGASRLQYETEGVAERALQFRARQNVILELGFFYGHLGWENVFVLQHRPPRVFPNFERPSDLDGAVFDEIDEEGAWKTTLAGKLRAVGFNLAVGVYAT